MSDIDLIQKERDEEAEWRNETSESFLERFQKSNGSIIFPSKNS